MDRPHCIRDQLWRWSTLIGLVISVGRTEMSFSIWQSCCILLTRTITKHVVAWVGCVQPECTIPLGTWAQMLRDWFLCKVKQTNKQTRTKVSFLSVQSPFIFDSDKTQTDTVIFCELAACKIVFTKITRSTYRHFRPSQSRKWVTVKWLDSWQTITRGGCVTESLKTPLSRPISICFELRASFHS